MRIETLRLRRMGLDLFESRCDFYLWLLHRLWCRSLEHFGTDRFWLDGTLHACLYNHRCRGNRLYLLDALLLWTFDALFRTAFCNHSFHPLDCGG